MNPLQRQLEEACSGGGKALIPFLTAGDPDVETTAELLEALSGVATACELGIPYSDPIADGPVIQASYTRALESGVSLERIAGMLACRPTPSPLPIVWMVSYAIVHRRGLERFVALARQSGVSGLIVPDLLFEESEPLRAICDREELSLIQLITPTTTPDRGRRIAEASRGFLYYVSVAGVTGERDALPAELADDVARVREWSPVPVCVGFGISRPEQARRVAEIADGVIIGSAFVRELEGAAGSPTARDTAVSRIAEKARAFAAALRGGDKS